MVESVGGEMVESVGGEMGESVGGEMVQSVGGKMGGERNEGVDMKGYSKRKL